MGKEKRFFAFFQKTFYKIVHFFGKSGAARKKALRDAHFCGTIKAERFQFGRVGDFFGNQIEEDQSGNF